MLVPAVQQCPKLAVLWPPAQTLLIRNLSRVPVGFAWQLPRKAAGVLAVTPAAGMLRGAESLQVTWTFQPSRRKQYDLRAACQILDATAGASGAVASSVGSPGATDDAAAHGSEPALADQASQGGL
jgi:hypothetical protein